MINANRYFGRAPACAVLLAAAWPAFLAAAPLRESPISGAHHPGCEAVDAHACVALAMQAIGGQAKLSAIANERLDVIGHTLLTEQSYRQAPFITAYTRAKKNVDFLKRRQNTAVDAVWPESDPDTASAESSYTVVANEQGAVTRADGGDTPGSLTDIDDARATLALGPERLLLTAVAAPDLHFEAAEMLRSTPHTVVAFLWDGQPVKVMINAFNHLPDATETTRSFNDFWFVWGDVRQRVFYDNWKVIYSVVYPTNRVEERNGVLWSSSQILDAKFNLPQDEKLFAMDPVASEKSARSKGWNRAFDDSHRVSLAPGIDLYRGSWNVTLIKQDDGVLVLEAPISPTFTAGALAKARRAYPSSPIKAVLSTSDSWPHVAGLREAVAESLPVYILDLNQPLLDRMIVARHSQRPDRLQTSPRPARWIIVSGQRQIGAGPNRVVLYPLRGAATERQYMVYFPERRVLYASDTLSIDPDKHTLYDPELMREVVAAVEREHLKVDTVYAMHEGPTPWRDVTRLVAAAVQ